MWFVKSRRAQNEEDFETWLSGGVVPTLNTMDNTGDTRATVLILLENGEPVIMRNREGCAGGGKGPMYSDKSFTLATINDQILIIDETRVNDVRVYEDGIVPTVISRYGTGGGNVPMVFPIDDKEETKELAVRRLTPIECERLQGFPDNWTADQGDSHRYKQIGNAVAVPVVNWIVNRMVNAQ